MPEAIDVIKERRSVRNYEDKEIPQDILEAILEAVRWTPSWANTQCWEFILVKSGAIKARLQETMGKGNPATKSLTAAPVVVAVCGKLGASGYYKGAAATKFGDWFLFDLGLATQTLCLAAHAHGLGTVVVGLFDHLRAAEILALPEGYDVACLVPLGYPAKVPGAPKRKESSEFVHEDTF